jgi:hypothetical protein
MSSVSGYPYVALYVTTTEPVVDMRMIANMESTDK